MVDAHELIYFTNQQKTTPQYICFTFNEGDDEKSTLYIKKWRVPDEIPDLVIVSILNTEEFVSEPILTEEDIRKSSTRKEEKIIITMKHISNHTHTVRYDSVSYNTGVNSLYIPCSSFKNDGIPEKIVAIFRWG